MIRSILYLAILGITSIGLIFKFLHQPGAAVLLVTGYSAIIIAIFEYFIKNFKRSSTLQFFAPILAIFFVLGVLFKINHWPYSNEMLLFSISSFSFVFINYAFKIRKSFHAILPLIFSVFFLMALLRVLRLPEPPYLLYGSYFVFVFLVPIITFLSAKNIIISNKKIGKNFLIISVISIVLCLIEYKIKFYPNLLGIHGVYNYVLKVILITCILLFIGRTLLFKNLKENYKLDHILLQFLGSSYLILMVILGLVRAYG